MVSKVVPIGILLLLSLSTLGQGTTRLRSAECRSGDKVSISVLVSDGKGSALLGLSSNNFKIRSNKNPVEVREFEAPGEPSSVGFLVDVSSWMQAHHVDIARRGMLKLVEKGHPDDEYFLVISGSKTTVRISSFSSGAVLRKIINEPKSFQSISGGKSVLYDGVSESLGLFESAKFKRKLLVVFGDGRSANSTISGDKLKELAATIATTVHFFGTIPGEGIRVESLSFMDVLYGIPSSVRSPIGQIAEQSGGFRSLPFGDNGIGGEIRPQLVQYRNKMYTPDDFRAALFSDAADTMRATYLIDFNIEASVKKSDQEKIDVEVDLPASRDINPTLRFRKECRVKK